MNLYLMQHAEALPAEEDPDRPLSPKGKRQVEVMAWFLARAEIHPTRILHSDKRRAEETAAIVAERIGAADAAESYPDLGPRDAPDAAASAILRSKQDIMVIGHMPHLGRLASLLMLQDSNLQVIGFEPAAVLCLALDAENLWTVRWMVSPTLLAIA